MLDQLGKETSENNKALLYHVPFAFWSEHSRSTDVNIILDNGGSKGNSDIFRPSFVSNPSSSNAPNVYNYSKAATKLYTGGASIKSKFNRSLIPITFNYKTVLARLVL